MLRNPHHKYGSTDLKVPCSLHFGEFILGQAKKFGNRTAFIDALTHETITYQEIVENSINLAVSLYQLGVRKGDTIAVCSENRREYWPSVIATICTGAVVTPINTGYATDELKHCLSITKPKYIFCSQHAYKIHSTTIKSLPFIKKIIVNGATSAINEVSYNDMVATRVNEDDFVPVGVQGQTDTVIVLYSSGTTGLPKGVEITHLNAIISVSMLIKPDLDSDTLLTYITIAPWYHAMGLWGTFGSISMGITTLYLNKFTDKLYLEAIQRYKPMFAAVVPPILVVLSKTQIIEQYDVSSILMMFCGAAPVDQETINEVKKRFPNLIDIGQAYGMTETTLAVSKNPDYEPVKAGSVGMAAPGSVIKIVDVDTRKTLGPNQRGELCVKGYTIMKGYVGKNNSEYFDHEGFFQTGDIAYYDDDGHFYIVDRLKELIKYKGYQVPPAEIEAVLLQHPAVRDAGVVGLPDKSAGEVPLAFIVKQPGTDVTEEEIKSFIASKLSNPKHLRGGVRFIEEIPKNPSGKILRRQLKSILTARKSKL